MKNIILAIGLITIATCGNAQVAIGKPSVDGTSTLLDFESFGNYRGIILPAVSLDDVPVLDVNNNGTFLYDLDSQSVQMYENGTWKAMSEEGNASDIIINTSAEMGEGAIIGSTITDASGVLVLESENMAMILPKIADPHETVKSPYPGMICYDTVSKTLAVFDGSVWNYWK